MPSKKLLRQYPYLAEYLAQHESNPLDAKNYHIYAAGIGLSTLASGVSSTLISVGMYALTQSVIATAVMGISAAVAPFVFGIIKTHQYAQSVGKPKNSHEKTLLAAHQAGIYFRKLDHEKKLHRWLDPVAAQLLEAGSYHWHRVQTALKKSAWSHPDLPQHWVALKERAQDAADLAMAELINLTSGCVGEPKRNRKDDLESVFEDFGTLDIQDALQGLRGVINSSSSDYTFQSPEARTIFEPGRQLAERLKDLAEEIEAAETRIQAETIAIPDSPTIQGTESIDHLLGEFRAVRQAEEELRQTDNA